jgi:hypothetical protein
MKFTFTAATLISLFGSALAFTNPIGKSQTTMSSLKMADTTPEKSKSVPFLNKNPLLDGSMPGDVGFDPFFLADSGELLYNYREAEIKHCRLAMLVRMKMRYIDEICCHSLTDSFVHVLLGCCWMAHFRITPTPLGQHLWTPACCRCQ